MTPKLIIIQGAPASGKTTLSRELMRQLPGVVLISKDSIKEYLFDTQPSGDRDWSRVLGKASISAMYAMAREFLSAGKHVMLESAFDSRYAAADIAALGVEVFEVYCRCDPDTLQERFTSRAASSRHPGHLDSTTDYDHAAAMTTYMPIKPGQTIEIDTTAGVELSQYEVIVRQLIEFLEDTTDETTN